MYILLKHLKVLGTTSCKIQFSSLLPIDVKNFGCLSYHAVSIYITSEFFLFGGWRGDFSVSKREFPVALILTDGHAYATVLRPSSVAVCRL